jgi:hypothetical protein
MTTNIKYIYTVLDAANRAKTKAEKVAVLQKYNSQGLRDMFYCQYSDKIEFALPEGAPPYQEFDSSKSQIPKQLSKIAPKLLKYLVKNGPGMKWLPVKRERKFLDIIEVIHPLDAKVVIAVKDKLLKEAYPTLTKNVVQTAFPTLLGNVP